MTTRVLRLSSALLVTLLLSGCATRSPEPPLESLPSDIPVESPAPAVAEAQATPEDRYWLPPLFVTAEDQAHYYASRLADRRFVDTYGAAEHPRVWYTAAEQLGQLGEPAIPLLFGLIDTTSSHELMLVLYALQLASQDPAVLAQTGGEYIQLGTVLSEETNRENRSIALTWWERHGRHWR
ncbi:hypothetical protein [Billgrantia endophytica]|uniref:HEAT repeat domain-containing protein n=1 Tax=Billgrantia endophytica TaxID=2033802 RepID=A0A2N7U4I9_9GAMM|nr:hypothetical protein [Halomonas endophytica]PMR75352.1 hypothetical protein C1H69_10550 [Halomonas endophytica]